MSIGWTARLGTLATVSVLLCSAGTAFAGKPDLRITDLPNPPSQVVAGQSFAIVVTVKNTGSADAPASSTLFWPAAKDKKTRVVQLQGAQALPALKRGQVAKPSATIVVPTT